MTYNKRNVNIFACVKTSNKVFANFNQLLILKNYLYLLCILFDIFCKASSLDETITTLPIIFLEEKHVTSPKILFSFLSKIVPLKKVSTEVPHALLFEKSCKTVFASGGCKCLTRVKHSKCCCAGPHVRQIPQTFPTEISMM